VRVLHAPIEIAGQLWEYADGLRMIGVNARVLTFGKHPFGYDADIIVELSNITNIHDLIGAQIKIFSDIFDKFDIFHFHFGESLIYSNFDLPALKFMGKRIVMNFWGSDVRLGEIAKKRNPFYSDEIHIGDDTAKVERMKILSRYVDAVLVSDYELYEYVEPYFNNIIVVPQAVDTKKLLPKYPSLENKRPKIVHAPSRTNVKGTSYIETAIAKLSQKYKFEYIRLTGVNHDKVMEALTEADIVIDQILLGTHGILSIEAMALGKPVICYIREDLLSRYPTDLPLVNANPLNIEKAIERLIKSPQLRYELGRRSRTYVESHHDKRLVAEKLLSVYSSLIGSKSNV